MSPSWALAPSVTWTCWNWWPGKDGPRGPGNSWFDVDGGDGRTGAVVNCGHEARSRSYVLLVSVTVQEHDQWCWSFWRGWMHHSWTVHNVPSWRFEWGTGRFSHNSLPWQWLGLSESLRLPLESLQHSLLCGLLRVHPIWPPFRSRIPKRSAGSCCARLPQLPNTDTDAHFETGDGGQLQYMG